ncbi:cupin domain-containing protein [Adhaeribacter terreus]|uniref:Cupin domain-containing protein n=1 Tax=Adhaeribacter terreus TaxID=529703 RepID=A0ABW0E7J1_9BACT
MKKSKTKGLTAVSKFLIMKRMIKYKSFIYKTVTLASLAVLNITCPALAQQMGVKRTELQRHNLSIPGREVIQSRIDFAPGEEFGNHSHPGEEIVYMIEGSLEYKVEGRLAVTLKAGDVLFIPAGVIHSAKNVGSSNGAELATYVVEKGKPLIVQTK